MPMTILNQSSIFTCITEYRRMTDNLAALDKTEEAWEYCQKYVEAAEMLYYSESGTPNDLRELALAYGKMGDILTKLGQFEEAKEYNQKCQDADATLHYFRTGSYEEPGDSNRAREIEQFTYEEQLRKKTTR